MQCFAKVLYGYKLIVPTAVFFIGTDDRVHVNRIHSRPTLFIPFYFLRVSLPAVVKRKQLVCLDYLFDLIYFVFLLWISHSQQEDYGDAMRWSTIWRK